MRELIHAAHNFLQLAFEGEEGVDALALRASESFSAIAANAVSANLKSAAKIFTISELAALVPEPVQHVVYPVAAKGTTGFFDGAPKNAGKTTLICAAIGAIHRGTPFLNYPTRPCRVLYVTEENPRTVRLAFERAGILGHARPLHHACEP